MRDHPAHDGLTDAGRPVIGGELDNDSDSDRKRRRSARENQLKDEAETSDNDRHSTGGSWTL